MKHIIWNRYAIGLLAGICMIGTVLASDKPDPTPGATGDDEEIDIAGGLDLDELRKLAQAEAEAESQTEGDASAEQGNIVNKVFKALGLGLQDLNPEISIVGDMNGAYHRQEGLREQFKYSFRMLALHFQAYVDPYTKFFAAFPVTAAGVPGIGEAYITRFAVLPNVNVTIGKFRQRLGEVNRWHKPALDQSDYPLALRSIFGGGGLGQTGISFFWRMPSLWADSQQFWLEVTNGENPMMFSGNTLSNPSVLARLLNYWDLSHDTYFEFGVTGLLGVSDRWDVDHGAGAETDLETHPAAVLAADLHLLWEPSDRMRYANVEWRAEAYLAYKEIVAPDGSGVDRITAWGAFTYLQAKVSRTVFIGARADYWEPDGKDYASHPLFDWPHLAGTHDTAWRGQASLYLTWYQSPFLHVRLEYQHLDGHRTGESEDWVILQLIFAVGPHLHERY